MFKSYFYCQNCGKKVKLRAPGTKNRNHCPFCLYSLHLDNRIGDRNASCSGKMAPVGKTFKKDGEEMIIHKCIKCGITRKNRIAGDDSLPGVEMLQVMDFDEQPMSC